MLESALEQVFNRLVKKAGGISIKMAPTVAGVPDRLVLWPGGASFLVELKTETGSVSKVQELWHRRAAALGHRVVVLYGRAQIVNWLEEVSLLG